MKILKILPKEIFKFEYDRNDSLGDLVQRVVSDKENSYNFKSKYQKIFDFNLYPKDFQNFLNDCIKYTLLTEKIKYESYSISLNWINIFDKNINFHETHTHQNSIYSGVYYYETLENDSICFYDIEPVSGNFLDILRKDFKPYYENKDRVLVKSGELLIFRSYLFHGVDKFYIPSNLNIKRISFSFNVDLQGIGSVERLTYR